MKKIKILKSGKGYGVITLGKPILKGIFNIGDQANVYINDDKIVIKQAKENSYNSKIVIINSRFTFAFFGTILKKYGYNYDSRFSNDNTY